MTKIVISEFMDDAAVARLAEKFEVHYDKTLATAPRRLEELVADCDALIVRNRTQVRGSLLDAAARLRVVGRLGVGLDNIDTETCRQRSITVIPATGANNVSVAEYVLAAMLMLARGCYGMSGEVASGAWPRERMVGGEIFGRRLGLVGFGGIAREVAARARAFGMTVAACDPFLDENDPAWREYGVERQPLDALLAEADFISLHVPLTGETRNLISAERLARMKPTAFIINTARGGVIDDDALAAALREGRLGGAMLDVYAQEPLPADAPIAGAPRCLFTAHIAGVTRESNTRVSALIADKVITALEG